MKRFIFLIGLLTLMFSGCALTSYEVKYVDGIVEKAKAKKELKDRGCKIKEIIGHDNRIYEIHYKCE